MSKKLNLGSGEFLKEGYVNVDYFAEVEPDVEHNLDEFPYPFDGDQFELIEADHVLEHLQHPFEVMREIHRIAEGGAEVVIRVPHFSRGFTHADHKNGFDVTFPYYFKPDFKGGYQGVPMELKELELTWFAQEYLKRDVLPKHKFLLAKITGKFIDFFANLSPEICSRIWCYWVGGFEQIKFKFKVKK